MNDAEHLISLYHTGFFVCLVLAVVFLLITVLLFFRFHIPALFAARSGRAMRKSIQEIEEKNARTGRLSGGAEAVPGGVRRGVTITQVERKRSGALSARTKKPSETSAAVTSVLPPQPVSYPIRFVIEKDIVLIHSDEIL